MSFDELASSDTCIVSTRSLRTTSSERPQPDSQHMASRPRNACRPYTWLLTVLKLFSHPRKLKPTREYSLIPSVFKRVHADLRSNAGNRHGVLRTNVRATMHVVQQFRQHKLAKKPARYRSRYQQRGRTTSPFLVPTRRWTVEFCFASLHLDSDTTLLASIR